MSIAMALLNIVGQKQKSQAQTIESTNNRNVNIAIKDIEKLIEVDTYVTSKIGCDYDNKYPNMFIKVYDQNKNRMMLFYSLYNISMLKLFSIYFDNNNGDICEILIPDNLTDDKYYKNCCIESGPSIIKFGQYTIDMTQKTLK